MKQFSHRLAFFGALLGVVALTFSVGASAHVVVQPAEVLSAAFQTFTVSVPNEKDVAVTSVKMMMPAGLKNVQPTQMGSSWKIKIDKASSGQAAAVKSITWSGQIEPGFREGFTFAAQVPVKVGEINWKAYQTYADGTVVAWDRPANSGESSKSGPFSVTEVVNETAADEAVNQANQAAASAKSTASTAIYIAVFGVVMTLLVFHLGIRKK